MGEGKRGVEPAGRTRRSRPRAPLRRRLRVSSLRATRRGLRTSSWRGEQGGGRGCMRVGSGSKGRGRVRLLLGGASRDRRQRRSQPGERPTDLHWRPPAWDLSSCIGQRSPDAQPPAPPPSDVVQLPPPTRTRPRHLARPASRASLHSLCPRACLILKQDGQAGGRTGARDATTRGLRARPGRQLTPRGSTSVVRRTTQPTRLTRGSRHRRSRSSCTEPTRWHGASGRRRRRRTVSGRPEQLPRALSRLALRRPSCRPSAGLHGAWARRARRARAGGMLGAWTRL